MDLSVFTQTLLALLVLCISVFYVYLRKNYNYWKNRNVPYEEPNILFGNLSFLMRKSFWDYFEELRHRFPTNDYVGIFLGWKPTLVVQTPELARKILTKDFEHFQNRLISASYELDPLGALNIFILKNPTWSKIRQELSPMFTGLRLKYVTELMNGNAHELVRKIKRDHIDNNEAVNLKELFSMYTSDTVGSSVFGIKVSALNDTSSPLWYITSHMVKFNFWRGFELTMTFLVPAVAKLMRLQFFSKGATDYIRKLFWKVVEERKASGANSNSKDLVNHLLKMKENLKIPGDPDMIDDYMIAQAAVFILGSIETSSTTLSYCLHELAHHPKEQVSDDAVEDGSTLDLEYSGSQGQLPEHTVRYLVTDFDRDYYYETLYEEISEAIKRKEKDVLDYDDLLELKYLTACILETLRKYPAVAHLDRICNKRYQLNDDVTIEQGTPVFVNVMALHHDKELFPEPLKWKPERMTNVQETDNLNFSLLPFGDGPRFCIGKRYGVMQIRAALAQLLLNYKILPDETEPYLSPSDPYAVLLSPLSGGKVKFALR